MSTYQLEWAELYGDSAHSLAAALDRRIASDRIDGILPAAAWALVPVAEAAARHELPALSCAAASYLSNRRSLRERLATRGVPQVDFRCADSPAAVVENTGDMAPPFYVVSDEGGSARESVTEYRDDLVLAAKRAISDAPSSGVVIETHPRGEILSTFCYVYGESFTVAASFGHRSAKAPFRFPVATYYPAKTKGELETDVQALARQAVTALQIDFGVVRVDMLACSDALLVLDVDPLPCWLWMPVDLIELAGGPGCIENMLRITVGEAPLAHDTPQAAALAWIPTRAGKIVSINGVKEAESVDGVAQIRIHVRPGDTLRHLVDSAGRNRVGYVAATGPDAEAALGRVDRALEYCRIETSTIT